MPVPRATIEDISAHLDEIGRHFKTPKITLVVRNPADPEGRSDLVLTGDSPDLVIAAIRKTVGGGDVVAADHLADDPVEALTWDQLRDEVRYWRENTACELLELMASPPSKLRLRDHQFLRARRLRDAHGMLSGAIAHDLHPRCEICGKAVRAGELVVHYSDVGEVHATCFGAEGDDLRDGARIPIDPEEVSVEDGEDPPADPHMLVCTAERLFTPAKIADILVRAKTQLVANGDLPAACRVCGCTDDRACITDAGACHWVEPDLCSNPDCVAAARPGYVPLDPETICSTCDAPFEGVFAMCDREEGRWCPRCFPGTDCGQGQHSEGCATWVHEGSEAEA